MNKPKADTRNSPIPLPRGSRSADELPGVSIDSGQITIDGALPYGRRLRRPMPIVVEQDDDEILVSEPAFQMHAGGATEAQALDAFRRIISGYIDVLESKESRLGEAARDQSAYLRSFIGPA
jgi:hypothetical protein